jgi:hypothetical protein
MVTKFRIIVSIWLDQFGTFPARHPTGWRLFPLTLPTGPSWSTRPTLAEGRDVGQLNETWLLAPFRLLFQRRYTALQLRRLS